MDPTEAVNAMIEQHHAPTAPLGEFLASYRDDDNIWWRIACGHHQNLFDAACLRIAELEARLKRVEDQVAEEITHGPLAMYYALRFRAALAGEAQPREPNLQRKKPNPR
jgi:hypothetical protein